MKQFHLKRADKIIICVLIAAAVLAAVFTGLSGKKKETAAEPSHQITHEDYIGKKIGVMTGTNMEQAALEFFPGSEYQYYDGYPDMNAALEAGIIDAYLGDEPALDYTGIIEKIRKFSRDTMQEPSASRNLMLCFEEIAVQNIIGRSGKDTSIYPILIEAEFSEKDRTLSMNFTWGGEAYNPVANGDAHNTGADGQDLDLSSAIVNRISKEIRYERDEKNHLLVVL